MTNTGPIVTIAEGEPHGLPATAISDALRMLRQAQINRDTLAGLDGGGAIELFENAFATLVGARYALAVSSGSLALIASLLAHDIGPEDEVIVSPYGWGQTVAAVLLVGATPVFADIDGASGNLDPATIAECIGPKTRAVLVTHVFGCPARMPEFEIVCREHGLALIADAAQALGATIEYKPIGAWGDTSCFSFGRAKSITTGEGGMVTCDDPDVYERLLLVCQHPLRALREVESTDLRASVGEINLSGRLSPFAAAIGYAQIDELQRVIAAREAAAGRIASAMRGIRLLRAQTTDNMIHTHAWHRLVFRFCQEEFEERDRSEVISQLRALGVPAAEGPVRTPIHLRSPFSTEGGWTPRALRPRQNHPSWRRGSCPIAEQRCFVEDLLIESPSGWGAAPAVRVNQIVEAIWRIRDNFKTTSDFTC